MTGNFLSGLSDAQGSDGDDGSDSLPEEIANLGSTVYNGGESDRLNPSIKPKKVYSEFQNCLETGLGRDSLVEYISENIVGLEDYGPVDTIGLKCYLLDMLDSDRGHGEGAVLGSEVYDLLEEFKEEDGESDFLHVYEVVVDDTSYC